MMHLSALTLWSPLWWPASVAAAIALELAGCARAGSNGLADLQTDAGPPPMLAEPTCDLSSPDLNACDACTREHCCAELQACAASTLCSGDVDAGAPISGGFGSLQACVLESAASGPSDEASVDACATMLGIEVVAQALTDCILAAPGLTPDAEDNATCGASCFGVFPQPEE